MDIIDAHVHLGEGRYRQLDVAGLLRRMDDAQVAFAIACPVDEYVAVDNREGNEIVLRAVRAHPDRLAGMASANPWYGERAAEEVRRALSEGLTGLKLNSVLQGFRLNDRIVDPLLEVAEEFDVPVYAHTGTAGVAEPFQLVELARRFPKINFLMGHGGASDYYNDTVRALEFAPNFWLETSRNGPANFRYWQLSGGIDRLVFGSDAPEYIPALEIETLREVFVDEADRRAILGDSVRQVYKGRLPV